jgi:PadR family transcriptional regulator PadR
MAEAQSIGSFEEQVMLGVLRTAGDAYGMAIRRELERVTGREVAIGAVYATLDRLESKGLVSSTRGSEAGSRRQFKLTRVGLRALAETRDARDRLWSGIDLASRGLAPRRA